MAEWFSDLNTLWLLGVAAGVLSTIAYLPYLADTATGRTQPQRASWLIWSILGTIAFFSQLYEGATASLWFAAVQVSGTVTVFLLSIWKGKGVYLRNIDYLVLAGAGLGLVLWYFTETAAYALAITISISLMGGALTVSRSYARPESETLVTWVVSLIASICALFAVGKVDPVLLAYPAYLFTLYTLFVGAILLGRRRNAKLAAV